MNPEMNKTWTIDNEEQWLEVWSYLHTFLINHLPIVEEGLLEQALSSPFANLHEVITSGYDTGGYDLIFSNPIMILHLEGEHRDQVGWLLDRAWREFLRDLFEDGTPGAPLLVLSSLFQVFPSFSQLSMEVAESWSDNVGISSSWANNNLFSRLSSYLYDCLQGDGTLEAALLRWSFCKALHQALGRWNLRRPTFAFVDALLEAP